MAKKQQSDAPVSLNPEFVVKARGFYNDNKPLIIKIVTVLVALFFIFYIAFQFYRSGIDKVSTVTAYSQSVNNSIFTKGYFVREEQYIESSAKGTLVPVAADGKKVSNGNTVAIAFGSDEDAANYTRIKTLQSELERYERLSSVSPSTAIDKKTMDSIISSSLSDLMDGVISGELDTLSDGYAELRDSIVKKQLLLGEDIDFQGIIDGIKAELSRLEQKQIVSNEILADGSGYFISNVDGFENIYDYTQIKNITPENASALFECSPREVSESVMGKLVTGFKWYIVCVLDIEQISQLSVGSKITVDFPYAATNMLKAQVAAVNVSGADKAAVVLECQVMDEELANMRVEDIELIFSTVSGFKIPVEAVREVEGVKGVYILRANLVNFREINIVWSDKEYVLTAPPKTPDTSNMTDEEAKAVTDALPKSEIVQYDEIIVKGKNLYDGKTLR